MKILAFGLAAVILSVCLGLPVERARTVSPNPAQSDEKGSLLPDVDDSETFFQNALRTKGPERDNSQKIDALLRRMTLEEKVGQMTQLAIGMIAKGRNQKIKIETERLDKAIC